MIERVDGDLLALANFLSRFVINVAGNVLLLIGVLIILAIVDLRIAGAVLAYLAVGMLAMVCGPFLENQSPDQRGCLWAARAAAFQHGRYPFHRCGVLQHPQAA